MTTHLVPQETYDALFGSKPGKLPKAEIDRHTLRLEKRLALATAQSIIRRETERALNSLRTTAPTQ